ncbi:hypothetical protein CVS27_19660 [Arthrobacter glacialis]|uniref:Uncharacterized protein n=1 Tax=Arthrobacter glacialis TaxID=1664 RepID=A0A2S3ZR24_ARTGL|nr:hypothetical protein CVS27_19660 [Arthrobacter glacialis]
MQSTVVFASGSAANLAVGEEDELADGVVVEEGWRLAQPDIAISRAVNPSIPRRDGAVFLARNFQSIPVVAVGGVDGPIVGTLADGAVRQQIEWVFSIANEESNTAELKSNQVPSVSQGVSSTEVFKLSHKPVGFQDSRPWDLDHEHQLMHAPRGNVLRDMIRADNYLHSMSICMAGD